MQQGSLDTSSRNKITARNFLGTAFCPSAYKLAYGSLTAEAEGEGEVHSNSDKEDSELNDIAYDEEKFVMNCTAYTEDSCWKTENLTLAPFSVEGAFLKICRNKYVDSIVGSDCSGEEA